MPGGFNATTMGLSSAKLLSWSMCSTSATPQSKSRIGQVRLAPQSYPSVCTVLDVNVNNGLPRRIFKLHSLAAKPAPPSHGRGGVDFAKMVPKCASSLFSPSPSPLLHQVTVVHIIRYKGIVFKGIARFPPSSALGEPRGIQFVHCEAANV